MSRLYSLYAKNLLTPAQAAAYAEVAESTIRQWVHRGLLQAALPSQGRGIPALYNKPDLDEVKRKLAEAEAERQAAWSAA
ncbi:helix-turn-helix domain-containing protein [Streptomyces sp. NPDC050564]|uniref:helix-turn-helix domain-containing protein n=1 Tax=Streptomyces sp. NPDC050564 TaxID=3365631 RepID=UPI00379927DC